MEDVGLMEERVIEMGKELSDLRLRESTMKEKLHAKNIRLRKRLQKKETQLATMESLFMEALKCRKPSKSYALFLKEQLFQFQIKALAKYGSLPFFSFSQNMEPLQHTKMNIFGTSNVNHEK